MRHRTSEPYGRSTVGSSMAARRQVDPGSAARTAAMRSAVNVAIPHRRGMADETNAIRMARSPHARRAGWEYTHPHTDHPTNAPGRVRRTHVPARGPTGLSVARIDDREPGAVFLGAMREEG